MGSEKNPWDLAAEYAEHAKAGKRPPRHDEDHGAHPPTADRGAPQDEQAAVRLKRASDITPGVIRWVWHGWLAQGKVHILAGAPGTGKTTLSMALAAAVTTGGRWPDGTSATAGDVLIWSGEDDPADTLIPRLLACGADLSRIHIVDGVTQDGDDRLFDPSKDVDALRDATAGREIRIMIVDPIVSAVTGDSHKNAEVRRALQPLADLAQTMGAALIGITHLTKGTQGREPTERITGSLAFGALARVVMIAAKGQEDDAPRILVRSKSNIGPDAGGWEYHLEQVEIPGYPDILNTRVTWGQAVDGSARDILGQSESVGDEEPDALREAMDWLRALLEEEKGSVPAKTVRGRSARDGLAWATVRRARDRLGIVSKKQGGQFGDVEQQWRWMFPSEDAQEGAQGSHKVPNPKNVSTFRGDEHLQGKSVTYDAPKQGENGVNAEGAQGAQGFGVGTFSDVEVF